MLNLHIVQALYGDCFLLEYGTAAQPRYMLVDGGPPTVYAADLQPVLLGLARQQRQLDCVVLSHADDDHIVGLVDLFKDLASTAQPYIGVGDVWMNSFDFDATMAPSTANIVLGPGPAAVPQPEAVEGLPVPEHGVAEGMDLRMLFKALKLPVNRGFAKDLVTLDSAPQPITLGNLALHMIGPLQSNLDNLQKDWLAWLAKNRPPEGAAGLVDTRKPVAPDQSIPNRSSIMFVAEADGKRVLMTGDGRAGDILRGLTRARLLPKDGVYHVDVFKLPHHGSARNNSRKLFSQVTADTYVISANGQNDNPDLVTLLWLVEAIREQQRAVRIVATNMTPHLEELVARHPPAKSGYELVLLPAEAHEFVLKLA